jgi:hypothetical protein
LLGGLGIVARGSERAEILPAGLSMAETVEDLPRAVVALSDRAARGDFAFGEAGHLAAEMVEAGKATELLDLERTLPGLGCR